MYLSMSSITSIFREERFPKLGRPEVSARVLGLLWHRKTSIAHGFRSAHSLHELWVRGWEANRWVALVFESGSCHQLVSQARRFGEAKSTASGQGDATGGAERDAMTHADEYRFDPVAGPNDPADWPAIMHQRCHRAGGRVRHVVRSDQQTLGAADAGPVNQQADVAGQTEPPGMGEPVSVEQEDVGSGSQSAQHGHNCRSFAKREQTGHVGESYRPPQHPLFNDGFGTGIPDDDPGDALITVACEREIDAGQQRGIGLTTTADQATGEPALDADGLGG